MGMRVDPDDARISWYGAVSLERVQAGRLRTETDDR